MKVGWEEEPFQKKKSSVGLMLHTNVVKAQPKKQAPEKKRESYCFAEAQYAVAFLANCQVAEEKKRSQQDFRIT